MPAAAVIPAPIAYIKVVAVKKLVVGSRNRKGFGLPSLVCTEFFHSFLLDTRFCSLLSGSKYSFFIFNYYFYYFLFLLLLFFLCLFFFFIKKKKKIKKEKIKIILLLLYYINII